MIDIEGFRNYLYEEELSKNTIDAYIRGVKIYSELFDEVTKPNMIEFKRYLSERVKPKTVNLRLNAMSTYCKYINLPITVKSIKEPKKTHIENVITVEQYERLMNGLRADHKENHYFNILLLAKTGMRISEALRVTKKDIENGKVTMPTKAHIRTIYFPQSLKDEMKDYLENFSDDDRVMVNCKGKPITSRGVAGALQRFAKQYDIPAENAHPHAFRHFFAIEFLKRNNNIALLADLLGHGSVNVTQIYLRQSQEEQERAIDKAVNW